MAATCLGLNVLDTATLQTGNLFKIQKVLFNKMHLKLSAKWRTICLGHNMLNKISIDILR